MASSLPSSAARCAGAAPLLISLFLFLLAAEAQQEGFNFGPEKRTQLHFFFHDVLAGPNATAVRLAPQAGRTLGGFGDIVMIDNLLTEESSRDSKLVGRAQGFYAGASQRETALLMAMNFYFVTGNYNGSTLAVLARNSVMSETREMSVVGGTGYFRLARGYAVVGTSRLNGEEAIVEYNVYVTHY